MFLRDRILTSGFIFLILFSYINVGKSEEGGIDQKKREIEAMETQLSKLEIERHKIDNEMTELAGRITDLKSKRDIGLIDRYTLENHLKQSQELAREFDRINEWIVVQERAYQDALEGLLALYEEHINEILQQLEEVRLKKKKNKGIHLLSRLVKLRDERRDVRKKMGFEVIEVDDVFTIEIDSLDGPKEILEKSDLLKDMEDKLKLKIALIDLRTAELTSEMDIREKVNQFLVETALYDETDEQVSRVLNRTPQGTYRNNDPVDNEWTGFWSGIGPSSKEDMTLDFDNREFWQSVEVYSFEEIEIIIEKLQTERARLMVQGDSLAKKADQFYNKAADLERNRHQ